MNTAATDRLEHLALEITGRCQLACTHCYADSGPRENHGSLGTTDWLRVIDEAAAMGACGVQVIGGEPTLRPDLPVLVERALALGLTVELYTNLIRMTDDLWALSSRPGVRIAASYYSPIAAEHNAITRRRSHHRTLSNIEEALTRSIPLRVGVIRIHEDQDVDGAVKQLRALGVTQVVVDDARQVGRAVRDREHDAGQLCGQCNDGRVAVLPNGEVVPCLLARWVVLGNIIHSRLGDVYDQSSHVRRELIDAWANASGERPKNPLCSPTYACGSRISARSGR